MTPSKLKRYLSGDRADAASAYLEEVSQRGLNSQRPSEMIEQIGDLRAHLGAMFAVPDGQPDEREEVIT